MTQPRKAQLLTIGLLAVALGIAVGRRQVFRSSGDSPPAAAQDAIYAMLDASRAGDIQAYLASYSDKMRSALEQSVRETGPERFSRYLKDSNSAIKGIAVSDPEQLSVREMKVRVEYVYQDRNEAQIFYLEKSGEAWKIVRVDGSERVKTLIPYGTPVQ
ncbi:MAG TPA: hypothetical protein VKE70_00025 [Candidatus Solibacter sp.]|nr:hypothetical protein [Candidatus Solibacter sp.]